MDMETKALSAQKASRHILSQPEELRTRALQFIHRALNDEADDVFQANSRDLKRSEAEGLPPPLLKRLKLDPSKLQRVIDGVIALEKTHDPLGQVLEKRELDRNLILTRVVGPIGVIGMIFESRPDALIQIASLCVRSGNAVILKGGSEAMETNRTLTQVIHDASIQAGLPEGWIHLAENREDVHAMLTMNKYIDLLIPRGSTEFVSYIMSNSTIPVLGHADGICHVYIDSRADPGKAIPIVFDSKMQYVAVCNAVETLLVHQDTAARTLPLIKESLESAGCLLLGCEKTRQFIDVKAVSQKDWDTEYLDAILSIRVVSSLNQAVEHIHNHGSGHTEVIVTEDAEAAEEFLARVDAADVFHNCSTRFSDGFVFGLGAEVGVSTAKIHARGPVGVEGLLSYRWQIRGDGHLIQDYNEGKKSFTHKELPL